MSMAGRRPMMSTFLFGSSLCRMVAVAVHGSFYSQPLACRQEKRRYTPVHVSKRPADEFYRDNG